MDKQELPGTESDLGRVPTAFPLPRRVFPSEAVFVVCRSLHAEVLLAVMVAAQEWLRAATRDELWRALFVHRWVGRQKPMLVREWWLELLACGAAPAAAATRTADPGIAEPLSSPKGAFPAGELSSWRKRFIHAERDMQRTAIIVAELCEDLAPDMHAAEPSARPFPRRWALMDGALEDSFLGDELQFNRDGTVESRSCLLILNAHVDARWCWAWPPGGDGCTIAITSDGATPGGAVQCFLKVDRAEDGGFVLTGPLDLVLCSRERTEVEHVYRRYGELAYPTCIRDAFSAIAEGRLTTPHIFPESLTSFERLAAHHLADRFGFLHDSQGTGLHRRVAIWREGDILPI